MNNHDPVNKVIVVKNSPTEFQLFIWIHETGVEPEYKKIAFEEDFFSQQELDFLEEMNPTLTMGRYYWDMLDSPDDEQKALGQQICQISVKEAVEKWMK